jgi:hypothetical protein
MEVRIPATLALLALLGAVTAPVAAPGTPSDHASAVGEHESLAEAAAAKRREAEGLAVSGPCKSADQCAVLRFDSLGQCTGVSHKAYSLVSATAKAAQAAAADYAALAQQVRATVPAEAAASCTPSGGLWKLECVAQKCVRAEQGLWPQEEGKGSHVQGSRK